MKTEQFNEIIHEQISRSLDVLVVKAKEYATTDRLHNFKVAAALKGENPVQALAGMMAKHTVSVYDMCMAKEIDRNMDTWNEKITDSINYLLILRALIEEDTGAITIETDIEIKAGSTVLHNFLGEKLFVLGVNKKENLVCFAGYPNTRGKLSDCSLIKQGNGITDEELESRNKCFGTNWDFTIVNGGKTYE